MFPTPALPAFLTNLHSRQPIAISRWETTAFVAAIM
jgi:hypothetical protein